MKRLLCIVGKMDAGGAETFLMKMYRKLDKTRYQMDFAVSIHGEGFYDAEIKELGGRIFHITPKSGNALKNFISIYQLVKENNYKYVMRISQHSLSALELFAAQLGGAKVRVFRSSNSSTTSASKLTNLLHKVCMFMPLVFANVRIAPSTEAADFMFGKNSVKKSRAIIFHNAIDLDVYKYKREKREKIRQELKLGNSFVVGHVGRFNNQKNHMFLLDVFSKILEKKPNSKLLLVGKGELEEAVKNKCKSLGIENSVIFTGTRNDIPDLLSAMDAFLFPSLYEGMPNTVIEAQATGLACIVSDTITKEANITGRVRYLNLSLPATEWALAVEESDSISRDDVRMFFEAAMYDIDSVVNQFQRLIFERY